MAKARTIWCMVAGTTILASIGAAQADNAVFRDVLKPHGHARSTDEKFADAVACGASRDRSINVIMPEFQKCMRAKGWAFVHYVPDPSTAPTTGTNVNFTDTRGDGYGHPRGTSALDADATACGAGSRDEESKPYLRCIAKRGWQFTYAQRATRSTAAASRETWSVEHSDAPSTSNIDDEIRRNDESRAQTQAAIDAMNASLAATAAQQAADQQRQNDLINQQSTAPQQ